ncbi:tetratricopeptide repeat protein [Persicimonas caeni]|nr:SEL1-like repeat protein [Persicimonas caeni]
MNLRLILVSPLLIATAFLLSCSTAQAPDAQGDLSKQGPCAASWNLRYERLVGHKCYPKRVVEAAKAGCKAGEKTSCKVARAVSRYNRTTHLDLEDGAVATAAAAGCKAGEGDGCALHGLELLAMRFDAQAAKIFGRGCKLGSRASCFEAARLKGEKPAFDMAHNTCDAQQPVPCRQQACRRGDGASCRVLGRFAEDGEHLERNLGEAVTYYEKACMLADMAGCGALGRFYARGQVVPRQTGVARKLFAWGCGPDNTEACVGAARMLAEGLGGERDPQAAEKLYSAACEGESGIACRELASLYKTAIVFRTKRAEIASYFGKGCELGDGPACAHRAEIELAKKPLDEQAVARVESLYRSACDAKFADGCKQGADRFYFGNGVPSNEKVAIELASKACELGSALHCTRAADGYRFGRGVSVDDKRATELVERGIELHKDACGDEQGRGCFYAAHAIAHGFPREKKLEEARAFLEKACEDGAKGACREIASQYVIGEIYPRERQRGIEKLRSLCDKGDNASCDTLADELSFGLGGESELADGLDYHRRGCFWYSNDAACVKLGLHYLRGHGAQRDAKKAFEYAFRACSEDGERQGCTGAGVTVLRSHPESDDEKSMPDLLQQYCVYDGNDSVCTPLARMYETGYSLPREPYRALSLYERVCDAEVGFSSEACSRAELVRLAKKTDDDADKSPKDLDKACKAGDAASCVLLARHHEFGTTDTNRFRKALPHYRKACELGSADACTIYVTLSFEEGQPWGAKFYEELAWACQKGTALMCYQWGNYMGSHNWDIFVRMNQAACAKGNQVACRLLERNLEPLELEAESSAKASSADKR